MSKIAALEKRIDRLQCSGSASNRDPIRLLVHFACPGAANVIDAVGSLPNVHCIHIGHPLDRTPVPTQEVGVAAPALGCESTSKRAAANWCTDQAILSVFRESIQQLQVADARIGRNLVLAIDAGAQVPISDDFAQRPSIRDLLPVYARSRVLALVTHPLLALAHISTRSENPASPDFVDRYARRYREFLDECDGVAFIRIEDVVSQPETMVARIAKALDLPVVESRLQSDEPGLQPCTTCPSGGSSDSILQTDWLRLERTLEAARRCDRLAALCDALGYPFDPDETFQPPRTADWREGS